MQLGHRPFFAVLAREREARGEAGHSLADLTGTPVGFGQQGEIVGHANLGSEPAHRVDAASKLGQPVRQFAFGGFRPAGQDVRHCQVIREGVAVTEFHRFSAPFERRAAIAF